jgi:hypothetical protein
VVAPIVGGFALLGALGSGDGSGGTDLGAHLFGFLAGVILGLAAAFPLRRATVAVDVASGKHGDPGAPRSFAGLEVSLGAGAPRWWIQATLGGVAAAIVIGSWELALRI